MTLFRLSDENGVTVRGNITADADADGKYEVFTEAPINGKRVNLLPVMNLTICCWSITE